MTIQREPSVSGLPLAKPQPVAEPDKKVCVWDRRIGWVWVAVSKPKD